MTNLKLLVGNDGLVEPPSRLFNFLAASGGNGCYYQSRG